MAWLLHQDALASIKTSDNLVKQVHDLTHSRAPHRLWAFTYSWLLIFSSQCRLIRDHPKAFAYGVITDVTYGVCVSKINANSTNIITRSGI